MDVARIVKEGPLRRFNPLAPAVLALWPSAKWQKFHATLDDKCNLAFFSSNEGRLKGQVVLTHDTSVKLLDKRPHSFVVTTSYTEVDLQALSDADRDDWIAALHATVARLGEENKQRDKDKWRQMRRKGQEKAASQVTTRGTHMFTVTGAHKQPETFEVDVRYELKRHVGQGAYGVVVAARDNVGDVDVAIKKVKEVFNNHVDGKRVLREVKIMRFLRGHPNIAHIMDLMRAPPPEDEDTPDEFNDLYLVMPLMDTDLHRVIHSNQKLSDQHCQFLLFQLLSAVYFMESAKIVHRDLKPSNILVNAACELKICDFGLARALDNEGADDDYATTYVVTRWYRAPELLLSCRDYTSAIDMWSVGCILAELFIRKALFPGEDYFAQIGLIIDVLGTPQKQDLVFVKEGSALKFLEDLTFKPKRSWRQIPEFREATDVCLELLDQLLAFSPEKRIGAKGALEHPYLQLYHGQPLKTSETTFGQEDRELRVFLEQGNESSTTTTAALSKSALPLGATTAAGASSGSQDTKKRKEARRKALLREAVMSEIAKYGREYPRSHSPGTNRFENELSPASVIPGGVSSSSSTTGTMTMVEEKQESA